MAVVFFSYAHDDEELRNELEKHLSVLKHENLISTWHDRRIVAGSEFDDAIDENLERADIVLLLVSSYFLSSDYCYNVEMKRALERHEAREAIVIPVILRPCDWHQALFGRLRATPPDGRPVTKFPDIHDGLLAVAKDIRIALDKFAKPDEPASLPKNAQGSLPKVVAGSPRSSDLRIRREFTDR